MQSAVDKGAGLIQSEAYMACSHPDIDRPSLFEPEAPELHECVDCDQLFLLPELEAGRCSWCRCKHTEERIEYYDSRADPYEPRRAF